MSFSPVYSNFRLSLCKIFLPILVSKVRCELYVLAYILSQKNKDRGCKQAKNSMEALNLSLLNG
jgi:hypothetical protein